ncbi:hypothetical protein JHK84_040151 [Glycine max]|nr:hypothetical protein JHK86_039936 [Glycine max]KAG5121811.1 hypothetical protein JHK84_040151 [Glycine max]
MRSLSILLSQLEPVSPTSTFRAFSDAEEDEEDNEEDQDQDQDNVSADEYDDVLGEASDEADVFARHDGFNWQRVDKLCNEVREFGADLIDVDELTSVYDFRNNMFQQQAILAFLRGFSMVVSASTSSGKTLIAEAAAVATVTRGRRIFYTTSFKALSNQKFGEFRETFGDSNVGLLTGDSAVNKDAQDFSGGGGGSARHRGESGIKEKDEKTSLNYFFDCAFLVFKLDESYTPSKVSIRDDDGFHNLKEIKTVELVKATGWVYLSLSGADPR